MSLRVNESEVFLEPFFRCRNSDLVDRDGITVNLVGGSISEDHEHRSLDFTASEISSDRSRCEECFVDVVVHDYTVTFDVFSTEGDGDFVHDGVADVVRMSETLALNDFEFLFAHGGLSQFADN